MENRKTILFLGSLFLGTLIIGMLYVDLIQKNVEGAEFDTQTDMSNNINPETQNIPEATVTSTPT